MDICGNYKLTQDGKLIPPSKEIERYAILKYKMNKETKRIESFVNWPKVWIDIRSLAREGFYYAGTFDRVICNFCDRQYGNFEAKDIGKTIHDYWIYPPCPLMNDDENDNEVFRFEKIKPIIWVKKLPDEENEKKIDEYIDKIKNDLDKIYMNEERK